MSKELFITREINSLSPYLLITIIIITIIHEIGHYRLAKKQGKYKSFGLIPLPHVKLTEPFNKAINYLSGFTFSLTTIPLLMLNGFTIIGSIILLLSISIGDLIIMTVYLIGKRKGVIE